MPDRSKKKHRQQLKRKEKARLAHKVSAAGPWKAIAQGSGSLQVWINSSWTEARQATIHVMRSFPGGETIFGAYLVDFGMAGLKDARYRKNMPMHELREMFSNMADRDSAVVTIEPDRALRFVSGAVRFAHDNGFRLPARYEQVISILGPLGDWKSADVSDFDMEFVGSMDDLRRRLIGQSVEDFLARDDVRLIIDDALPSLLRDAETADADDLAWRAETIAKMAERIIEKSNQSVRQWCASVGETPEPLLDVAIEIFAEGMATLAIYQTDEIDEDMKNELVPNLQFTVDAIRIAKGIPDTPELTAAMMQFIRFTREAKSIHEIVGTNKDQAAATARGVPFDSSAASYTHQMQCEFERRRIIDRLSDRQGAQ